MSDWKPTKIKHREGHFSVNPSGVAPGSLYITLEAFRVLSTHKSYLHGHLVDLGCGDVPYYEWYKDEVNKITCVDWSRGGHGTKHTDIFADLNKPLPLTTESADCVLLTSVLEHIHEPELLLKEIQRILRKGGYLILSVPFLYHLHEEPFDYYRYTPHGLRHLAKKTGLGIISLTHYGGAFGVLVDETSKISQSIIDITCKSSQNPFLSNIKSVGYKILRWFQQFLFFVFKQRGVLRILERLRLTQRMALGYVAVFSKTSIKDKRNND